MTDDLFPRIQDHPHLLEAFDKIKSRLAVARAISNARMEQGLSQDELARRAGTKQGRISELESMRGNVRFDTLDHVARALGLAVTLCPADEIQPSS